MGKKKQEMGNKELLLWIMAVAGVWLGAAVVCWFGFGFKVLAIMFALAAIFTMLGYCFSKK